MANSVLHTFTSLVNQPSYDSNPSLSFWLCRGTAFGILNGICKFAAIIASSIFAAFIGITKIIPIFLAFAALVCGGMVALKLPETREKILSWKAKLLQPLGPKHSLAMGEAAYSGESISFLNWNRKVIKKGHVVLDVCHGYMSKTIENLSGCLYKPVVAFCSVSKYLRLPSFSVTLNKKTSLCLPSIFLPTCVCTHCSNICVVWGSCKRLIWDENVYLKGVVVLVTMSCFDFIPSQRKRKDS